MTFLKYFQSMAFSAILLVSSCAPAPRPPQHETLYQNPNPTPPQSRAKNILVRDKDTAIAIAKAIWIPVYGERTVHECHAFDAVLTDGVWTVTGQFKAGVMDAGT